MGSKEEILERLQKESRNSIPVFKAMDEYTKRVLEFVLYANENGIKDNDNLRIVMVDGEFYWEDDRDGDQPINPERIIELYEKVNQQHEAK